MKNLLIIGGAARNVGKTTFIENIIRKFSTSHKIVSIKIKTIYPNDYFFHGKDVNPLSKSEPYRITEIKKEDFKSDSGRMLNAGAYKVYKIKTKAEQLLNAFNNCLSDIGENVVIICETNSLRGFVRPALYLFIKMNDIDEMKQSAKKLCKFADKIILSNGEKHDFDFNNLNIQNNSWQIKKNRI
ncbi:MAG: hypothetical protein DRI94_12180 [Bacteroidetes bacterium]|nr:MAG: hypothetical protein DRI94_12180 [Bacteroidota bacterium]